MEKVVSVGHATLITRKCNHKAGQDAKQTVLQTIAGGQERHEAADALVGDFGQLGRTAPDRFDSCDDNFYLYAADVGLQGGRSMWISSGL